jgi:ketosteroid isomerase-like protein
MVQGFYDGVPDLKLELVDCKADENGGWVEWTFSGTDKGLYKTGKKFSVRGASVFQLRGGKFSTNKDYYDAATIMKQVGALPQQ